jgi:hypothetical protein
MKFFKFRNSLKESRDNFKPIIKRDTSWIGLKNFARMYIRAIDRYNYYECDDYSQKNSKIKKLCKEDIEKIKSKLLSKYECLKDKDVIKTRQNKHYDIYCIAELFYKDSNKKKYVIDNSKNIDIYRKVYVEQHSVFTPNEWDGIIERFNSNNVVDVADTPEKINISEVKSEHLDRGLHNFASSPRSPRSPRSRKSLSYDKNFRVSSSQGGRKTRKRKTRKN